MKDKTLEELRERIIEVFQTAMDLKTNLDKYESMYQYKGTHSPYNTLRGESGK